MIMRLDVDLVGSIYTQQNAHGGRIIVQDINIQQERFLFMHCVKNAFQICNINIFIIMLLACHFMTFHTIPLDIHPLLNKGRYCACTQGVTAYGISLS